MWKCHECGEEFDEPKYYQECVGEFWGAPAYETWVICPHCKSEDIEEDYNYDNGDD